MITTPPLSPGATLALVCAVYAAAGTTLAAVGPSLPSLATNVGEDVATVGAQFTAFAGGTVLVQAVTAWAGERLGQRAVLGAGAALLGLGALAESLSPSLLLLLLGALLGGLGFGCVLSGGNVLVARLFAARGTSALNFVNLFFGVGSIVGPLLAGVGLAWRGAPELAMMIGGAFLLALAPAVFLAAEPQGGAGRGRDAPPTPWGLVLLLGLLLLVYSGTEIAVGGWAALFLERGAGMAPAAAALAVSGFWLALTLGRGLGALVGFRVSAAGLLLAALGLLLVAALMLLASLGSQAGAVAALCLFGLACGPIFPTTLALVTRVTGGRGAATSMVLAVANLGGASIPPLLGLLLTGVGPRAGATFVLGGVVLMLVLLGAVTSGGRRRAAARA